MSKDFVRQMQGFSLTTAEIVYRLPDYPSLLQSYIWQEYDVAPKFPKLKTFLEFWRKEIEGELFKVFVANRRLIKPAELKMVSGEFRLN